MTNISSQPIRSARRCVTAGSRTGQAGLTLIEFMVSIVIGMLLVAALATLIASQSSTRGEIDKSGRMIENGRYAAQTLANDIQMAGYWGELGSQPPAPGTLPDPCSKVASDLQTAMGVHVQAYDGSVALPASLALCVKNQRPNTDVLVVRKAEPDMSTLQNSGSTDLSKLVAGQAYLQTGMDSTGATFTSTVALGGTATDNATAFTLKKKDKVTLANLRMMSVHIYYISNCSVEISGSCTNADGGNPVPTLKRLELGASAGSAAFSVISIAEGIENMQFDYGVDSDGDGSPNGSNVDGTALAVADWANVVTLKVYLLARSNELTAGFSDTKTYAMGTLVPFSPASSDLGYKRHLFVQSVRLVNPSGRRAL